MIHYAAPKKKEGVFSDSLTIADFSWLWLTRSVHAWKIALSLLYKVYNDDFINYIPNNLKNKSVSVIKNIIDKKINSPETSSIGRLFDGISALIGLIEEISFEGEAAIILENISYEEIINKF